MGTINHPRWVALCAVRVGCPAALLTRCACLRAAGLPADKPYLPHVQAKRWLLQS
jgi:hypothetical protein